MIDHFLAVDPDPVADLPADWDTTPGVAIYSSTTIQNGIIDYGRPLGFQSRSVLEPTCSAVEQDRWTQVSYDFCTDRFCEGNDPYQGHYNYGIVQVSSTTNWTGSTIYTPAPEDTKPLAYDVLFNYFQDYGSDVSNTALCTLHVDTTGNTVTCTKSEKEDRVNRGEFEATQAANAILSGLRRYHSAATALYGECEAE